MTRFANRTGNDGFSNAVWSKSAIFAAFVLTACNSDNGPAPGHIDMPANFVIPACSKPVKRDDGIHYVTKTAVGLPTQLTLTYEVTGDGVFAATEGNSPQLRLYFQRKGDDWSAKGEMQSYRWYSTKSVPMAKGVFTISALIIPSEFSDVFGGRNALMLTQARQAAGRVGFVLGGSEGAGHGVCMTSGSAKFIVKSYEVK